MTGRINPQGLQTETPARSPKGGNTRRAIAVRQFPRRLALPQQLQMTQGKYERHMAWAVLFGKRYPSVVRTRRVAWVCSTGSVGLSRGVGFPNDCWCHHSPCDRRASAAAFRSSSSKLHDGHNTPHRREKLSGGSDLCRGLGCQRSCWQIEHSRFRKPARKRSGDAGGDASEVHRYADRSGNIHEDTQLAVGLARSLIISIAGSKYSQCNGIVGINTNGAAESDLGNAAVCVWTRLWVCVSESRQPQKSTSGPKREGLCL